MLYCFIEERWLGNSLESPTFQWKGTGQNTNTHCKLY